MIISSTPTNIGELREDAHQLLNEFDPADALASYYMLHHDPKRTNLFIHRDASGTVDGALARCQTGFDLFRPLVALRVRGMNDPAGPLLRDALVAGRPYIIVIPASLEEQVAQHVTLNDPGVNHIMRLDPEKYQPEINALVVTRTDPEGNPRAEIRRKEDVVAQAGVNWRSPIFAEMYVQVEPEARGRGWGRTVVRAVAGELLKMRITPLYTAAEDNHTSLDLAVDVGFVDTGAREIMAQAIRPASKQQTGSRD